MSFQNRIENLTTNTGTSGQIPQSNGVGSLVSFVTPPYAQYAFSAYKTAASNNVTGAGTTYVVAGYTEEFDIGNNFNPTTGQFTVPATGRWYISASISVLGLTAAMDTIQARVRKTTPSIVMYLNLGNPYARAGSSTAQDFASSSMITQLTSGDVLELAVTIQNGAADDADVNGGVGVTYFCAFYLGA